MFDAELQKVYSWQFDNSERQMKAEYTKGKNQIKEIIDLRKIDDNWEYWFELVNGKKIWVEMRLITITDQLLIISSRDSLIAYDTTDYCQIDGVWTPLQRAIYIPLASIACFYEASS